MLYQGQNVRVSEEIVYFFFSDCVCYFLTVKSEVF